MTSENEINTTEAYSFPPPSNIILSNLANQLLSDEHFYVAVLNLAKQFGYSAVYQRKVTVNPRYLNVTNKCSQSDNLESLGGHFVWVPYSGCPDEEKNSLKVPKIGPSLIGKKIWSKRRKAAYLQTGVKIVRNVKPLEKLKPGLRSSSRIVKISIDNCKINDVCHKTSTKNINDHAVNALENIDLPLEVNDQSKKIPLTAGKNVVKFCQIKSSDYDLFPIFENYKEGLPGNKIYVKNLSKTVNLQDLQNLFGDFVIPCEETSSGFNIRFFERGKLRRQAFVTYPNTLMATEACRSTNGIMLKGKPILVVFAHGCSDS